MKKNLLKNGHRVAALSAMFTIIAFLATSLYAALKGDHGTSLIVKRTVVYCLPLLFIFISGTVISGRTVANPNNEIVKKKKRRMKFIGFNGLLLIFLAISLYLKANSNQFDHIFWSLQLLEFLFGGLNITLMIVMAADGMKLSGRLKGNRKAIPKPNATS